MGQPTWRQLKTVIVPEREGVIWTPALDYLTPGKLYRIRVEPKIATAKAPESNLVEAAPEVVGEKAATDIAANKPPDLGKQPGPLPYREAAEYAREKTALPATETAGQQSANMADAGTAGRVAGGSQRLQDQRWKPESSGECTADGDPAVKRHDALLLPNGVVGALIGKIGGSAGDTDFDKDKVVLFTVGRHCVFVAPDAPKVGSLYLGMNDTPASAGKAQNELRATIWESL